MAKLYFRYGAMNSGKSTDLIQVAYNYHERGQRSLILKPATDTKDEKIVSRIGYDATTDHAIYPDTDIRQLISDLIVKPDCLLVDEAQFLTERQVDELFWIATTLNIPAICYGLRTDFRTEGFPGSDRLLQLSHSVEERKTICRCGKKATFNARHNGSSWVRDGEQVEIDDGTSYTYESMCGSCYINKVGWTL